MKKVVAIFLPFLMIPCSARVMDGMEVFDGRSVHLEFKKSDYRSAKERPAAEGSDAEKNEILFDITLTRSRQIGGSSSDSGTVCRGTVAKCQSIGQGILPYWIDAGNSLRIGEPTEVVREVVIANRRAFEAFPLCGWDHRGATMPVGGQCYTVVMPLENKVVSLSFLLGKNVGCRRYESCWRKELAKVRAIAASAK